MDVPQFIHNTDNAILEGPTYTGGWLKLIRELAEPAPEFCASRERPNEFPTQVLSMV